MLFLVQFSIFSLLLHFILVVFCKLSLGSVEEITITSCASDTVSEELADAYTRDFSKTHTFIQKMQCSGPIHAEATIDFFMGNMHVYICSRLLTNGKEIGEPDSLQKG